MKKRGGILDKEVLSEDVRKIFTQSQSLQQFYSKLEKQGFTLYKQRGKVRGIITSGKWRLTTLGIEKEKLNTFEKQQSKMEKRMAELNKLMQNRNGEKELER